MPQTAVSNANPQQLNRSQRNAVLMGSVEMLQQIFSQGINPANQTVVNVNPRNVGLVKRFIVKITGQANNTGAGIATLTDLGLANLLSQVSFNDLNNNQRILTTGWHLAALASLKQKRVQAGALLSTAFNEWGNIGNNFGVIVAPASIAAAGNAPFTMYFEVPLAYSDEDLRGAVYMNVVNAVAQLTLTLNAAPFQTAGADSTLAVWHGSTQGNISNVTITVYQEYLDQLPMGKNGVILPALDLSTVYELKNTAFPPFVANQDNPIPYANFRDFLSVFAIYNHDGSADSGRTGGTDLNYLALQSANFTNLFRVDPITQAYRTRKILESDLPAGMYYISHRKKPVSTTNYGNIQLVLNPITAAAQNYTLVGWEDFALVNTLNKAGSLSA